MSTAKATYHHGDLRAALLRAATELLEEGGATALSLRAVARRAGVSPAAPYRHSADREALVSAAAAGGGWSVEGPPGPTPTDWPPPAGRWSTGWRACTSTASSMPAARRWSPTG